MILMNYLFLLFATLFVFASCESNQQKQAEEQTVRTWQPVSSDIEGTYEGEFPCTDCEAMNIRLKLDMDQSAIKTVSKVGAESVATTKLGEWNISNEVVSVTFSSEGETEYYKPSQNQLVMMDSETVSKTGKAAKNHTLSKVQ